MAMLSKLKNHLEKLEKQRGEDDVFLFEGMAITTSLLRVVFEEIDGKTADL